MATATKPKRVIDLSGLDDRPEPTAAPGAAPSPAPAAPTGEALQLAIADIDEDPDQPRVTFSAAAMEEMTASVAVRGVISPVSVRPHPDKPGRWMLNYGARRLRGSIAAGKTHIPAFVDNRLDRYDQVVENLQREELTAMELAQFIAARIAEGDKKKVIADKLGVDPSVITNHLALVDAPAPIERIYRAELCTSAKTLYELRSLYDKYPEQVEAWCDTAEEVTRKTVSALADQLKSPKQKQAPSPADDEKAGLTESGQAGKNLDMSKSGDGGDGGSGGSGSGDEKAKKQPDDASGDGAGAPDDGSLTSWPPGKAVSDPDAMKKPLLLVEYDGRAAAVLLNRKPSAAGLIRIRYEDGGGDAEVSASELRINSLTETKK